MERVKLKDLGIGDFVAFENMESWNHAIVKQIKDDVITFFRPYGETADFVHTGGVICYVGIEEFKRFINPITNSETVIRTRIAKLK